MKITYTEKGNEHDYKRIDTVKSFFAKSYFQPSGTSLIYFRIDDFNIKTVSKEDIIAIEE